MKKKPIILIGLTTSIILLGACSKNADEEETTPLDQEEVIVNNGDLEETELDEQESDEDDSDDTDSDEQEEIPEREVYDDKVPSTKSNRDKIIEYSIKSEKQPHLIDAPDLREEYITVNSGVPQNVDFNATYNLFNVNAGKRGVGGVGVVRADSLGEEPQEVNGSESEVYEIELLSTSIINDERGHEAKNKAVVTKQAYNLLTELNQNIYRSVDPSDEYTGIYVHVQAIYDESSDVMPVGIQIQAQSKPKDIDFHYIISNIQKGYEVDYINGKVRAGGQSE